MNRNGSHVNGNFFLGKVTDSDVDWSENRIPAFKNVKKKR